jgi:hypothetical protein
MAYPTRYVRVCHIHTRTSSIKLDIQLNLNLYITSNRFSIDIVGQDDGRVAAGICQLLPGTENLMAFRGAFECAECARNPPIRRLSGPVRRGGRPSGTTTEVKAEDREKLWHSGYRCQSCSHAMALSANRAAAVCLNRCATQPSTQ